MMAFLGQHSLMETVSFFWRKQDNLLSQPKIELINFMMDILKYFFPRYFVPDAMKDISIGRYVLDNNDCVYSNQGIVDTRETHHGSAFN